MRRAAVELEVLLDLGVAVADMEAGMNALGQHPRARRLSPGALAAATEEELDLVRAAEVEMVADHLLEELATVQRSVEDPGVGDLRLQDGELVGVPAARS